MISLSDARLDIVLFRVGDVRLGVEACQVRSSHAADPGDTATLSAEVLLQHPSSPFPLPRQVLTIRTAAGERCLQVRAPVELRGFSAAAIYSLPPFIAARCALPGLSALAFDGDVLIPLVDLAGLLLACPEPVELG